MKRMIGYCLLGWVLVSTAFSDALDVSPAQHQGSIIGADISPDGKTLATASADGTVKLWDIESGVLHQTIFPENLGKGKMIRVKFLPQQDKIIISGFTSDKPIKLSNSSIYLYDIKNNKITTLLDSVATFPTSMCLSKDGNLLAMGTNFDGEIQTWKINTQEKIHQDVISTEPVFMCHFDIQNNLVAVSRDQIIKVYTVNGEVLSKHITKEFLPKGTILIEEYFDNKYIYMLSYNKENNQEDIFKIDYNDYLNIVKVNLPYSISTDEDYSSGFIYDQNKDIFYLLTSNNSNDKYLYLTEKEVLHKCKFDINGNITNAIALDNFLILTSSLGGWKRINLEELKCEIKK